MIITMIRLLSSHIIEDLQKKLVILSGPRQCGKTYLAKNLISSDIQYLNFDVYRDHVQIMKREWNRQPKFLILDEIHKMKKWKQWLKGIVDDTQEKQKILVTGSAKVNTFKKMGDSLAGRYFAYRMYPLDVKEVLADKQNKLSPETILDRLLEMSGFPEPFLSGKKSFYNKWQQTHLDVILKQDILETESVRNIKQLEALMYLLPSRVGSILSYNSLREDLHTDDKSIRRWVDILETSFAVFRIYPFSPKGAGNITKKAPKIYYFDIARIDNLAARLENLVALSLLKEIHYRQDCLGQIYDLHFIRNKQQREVDFLITKNRKPITLIEVKQSDGSESENFHYFTKYFPEAKKVQLVYNLEKPFLTKNGVQILPMAQWLAKLEID
jgi:predicted AAA+ superfamily ATPase